MYVIESAGLGHPSLIGLIPAVVGAYKSVTGDKAEAHILDRVAKWKNEPDDVMRDIASKGGEAGEAARRVLASRGLSTAAPAPAPEKPLIDLSKLIKLPEMQTSTRVEMPSGMWLGLAVAMGVGLLALTSRPGRR
jgi:hypothetical protein